eukprot:1145378-Pelagomonas_calceolata.AAC.13
MRQSHGRAEGARSVCENSSWVLTKVTDSQYASKPWQSQGSEVCLWELFMFILMSYQSSVRARAMAGLWEQGAFVRALLRIIVIISVLIHAEAVTEVRQRE